MILIWFTVAKIWGEFKHGPAGAFEQKLTVSFFVEHANRNFLNVL